MYVYIIVIQLRSWPFSSVSGLDYVQQQAKDTKRASVVNMSLGGSTNPTLDNAVDKLTTSDPPVHVVVAAGNSNVDASLFSPARARTALTVGASDINDARASFFNFGMPVKVFAPGVTTHPAWNTSDTVSSRCVHLENWWIFILGHQSDFGYLDGVAPCSSCRPCCIPPKMSPNAMIKKVQDYALVDRLSGVREYLGLALNMVPSSCWVLRSSLTVNLLVQNRKST